MNRNGEQSTSIQEERFIQDEVPKMITLMKCSRVPNKFFTIYRYFSFNQLENGNFAIIPHGFGGSYSLKTSHGHRIESRVILIRDITTEKWKIHRQNRRFKATTSLDLNEIDSDWVNRTTVLRPKINHVLGPVRC